MHLGLLGPSSHGRGDRSVMSWGIVPLSYPWVHSTSLSGFDRARAVRVISSSTVAGSIRQLINLEARMGSRWVLLAARPIWIRAKLNYPRR